MALIDELTAGQIEKYDEYYLMPHALIMQKLWLNTEKSNYRSRLNRIKSKQ